MAEYVEREVLLKAVEKMDRLDKETGTKYEYDKEGYLLLIQNAPTAYVVEERHGEWLVNAWDGKDWAIIPYKERQHTDPFCSRCKEPAWREPKGGQSKPSKYCPNCGAKMDGKGEAD